MKKYLFCLFLSLALNSFSQKSDGGIEVGAGFFQMKEFKVINEEVLKDLPFEAKITDNFPANIVYKGYFHHTYQNNFGIGFKISFSSTGSLISREDYSGSYYFKNQAHYYSPGFIFDYCIYSFPRLNIVLYNEIGWEFNVGKFHENLTVNGQTQEDELEYRSVNIFTEPGCKVVYSYSSSINVGLYAGYLIDTHREIKPLETSFKTKELYDIRYGKNSFNWTGLRFGISISYTFQNQHL
ncbi:MAG: hypothetical protein WC780_04590 [Lentimicrobiaceae bacterium]|jgi:hypothetical protein